MSEFNTFFDQSLTPQTNHQLYSTECGWALRIDLPGFSKEELSLNFEDKALVLVAEQSEEIENRRNKVAQRYALGEEVDTTKITAALESGVFEIHLPRRDAHHDQTVQINIQ